MCPAVVEGPGQAGRRVVVGFSPNSLIRRASRVGVACPVEVTQMRWSTSSAAPSARSRQFRAARASSSVPPLPVDPVALGRGARLPVPVEGAHELTPFDAGAVEDRQEFLQSGKVAGEDRRDRRPDLRLGDGVRGEGVAGGDDPRHRRLPYSMSDAGDGARTISKRVISGGEKRRIGGPQVPVPRLA